jgi:hypothetical protein
VNLLKRISISIILSILVLVLIGCGAHYISEDKSTDNKFFKTMKSKYDFLNSYEVSFTSTNDRALCVEYYINSDIYDTNIDDCFNETRDYIMKWKEKSEHNKRKNKLNNIREIIIRFLDKEENHKEYSSYYYRLGSTIYAIKNESLNEIDNFDSWIVEYIDFRIEE